MAATKGPWPGVHALLLAAGGGARFGGAKLTASWRGEPLICAAARIALASPAERVTAILGHDAHSVSAALTPLIGDRLSIAMNPDWREGLSASLRVGLRALPASTRRIIMFLGDMPLVDPHLAARLLSMLDDASAILPMWRGRPAHPVVFRADLIPSLMSIEGDQGARKLLGSLPGVRVIEIEYQSSTLDVDTPGDLARLAATAPTILTD